MTRNKPTPRSLLAALLPYLILIFGAGVLLYYIIGPSAGYMTSDCTDSIRWAEATLDSGKLISDEFYYAAILPFGGNLIFLPFVALFGYSMTAQICGLCLFVLLLVGALWYFASGLGYSKLTSASLVTLTLTILASGPKLREIMFEHIFYYNLGILFFCLGFGLALRIVRCGGAHDYMRSARPADWIRVGALALFSLAAATDGLQTLICFTLPIVAGIALERFLDADCKPLCSENAVSAGTCAVVGFFSLVGYIAIPLVSGGVTAGYATAYSAYSSMGSWTANLQGFLYNWLTLLGVSVADGEPLVSASSVLNMIRIFGVLLLLVAPIILACRYNKIESRAVKSVLIGHFAVSAFILFAVTCGKLGGANWRLTPMLGTSVLLTFVTAVELIRQKKAAARVGIIILVFLLLLSAVSILEIADMPADYGADNAWHTAAEQLEERGLRYGYANFWWAESITLFSDGAVTVANLYPSTRTPTQYNYQQPHGSYDDRKDADSYFLLLTESENSAMASYISGKRAEGAISEEFTIESEPYNLRGYVGERVYVYVFPENIF